MFFSFDQVRVAVDLKAPSIKAGEPVLREVFRGGMVEPGALDPRQADILASTMAARMRPPLPGVVPGAAGAAVPGVAAADVGPGFNGPDVGPGFNGPGGVAGPRGVGGILGGGRGRVGGHRPGNF